MGKNAQCILLKIFHETPHYQKVVVNTILTDKGRIKPNYVRCKDLCNINNDKHFKFANDRSPVVIVVLDPRYD